MADDSAAAPLLEASGLSSHSSGPVVAALLFSLCFTTNVIISLLYPFAPGYLNSQGYDEFFVGFIFSIYSWSMLLSSPVSALFVARFGRSKMLCLGIVLIAAFSSLFGYAAELSFGVRWGMTLIYAGSRIMSGFGASLTNLAVFSMAADVFADDLGKVMGVNEVVIGLGFTLGPPIGSVLYVNLGFGLTFLITSAACMLSLPLAVTEAIKHHKSAASVGVHYEACEPMMQRMRRVTNARVLLAGGLCFSGTLVFGVMEPFLAAHLSSKAGLSQTSVGIVFAVFSAAYSCSGVPLGWVADKHGHFFMCICGIFTSGGCLTLMGIGIYGGLAESLNVPETSVVLAKDLVLLVTMGVGQAMLLVPTLPAIKDGAAYQDAAATEAVVTIFNSFQQLGLAVGPLVGAFLVHSYGYETALFVTGLILMCYGCACLLNYCLAPRVSESPLLDDGGEENDVFAESEDDVHVGRTSSTSPMAMSRRSSLTLARSLSRSATGV